MNLPGFNSPIIYILFRKNVFFFKLASLQFSTNNVIKINTYSFEAKYLILNFISSIVQHFQILSILIIIFYTKEKWTEIKWNIFFLNFLKVKRKWIEDTHILSYLILCYSFRFESELNIYTLYTGCPVNIGTNF